MEKVRCIGLPEKEMAFCVMGFRLDWRSITSILYFIVQYVFSKMSKSLVCSVMFYTRHQFMSNRCFTMATISLVSYKLIRDDAINNMTGTESVVWCTDLKKWL